MDNLISMMNSGQHMQNVFILCFRKVFLFILTKKQSDYAIQISKQGIF